MILLIDNYDSFVHNLARYFALLGLETVIVRNDATSVGQVRVMRPSAIVLSPGPCTPAEAGCSVGLVQQLHGEVPMLGVCLGHQAIAAALGASIVRAPEPRHGRTSLVAHRGSKLFAGIPSPFSACRYHSLMVNERELPGEMAATAWADDGTVMAIEHSANPVFGVQFHPEAALTEFGYQLIANFLQLAGCKVDVDVAAVAKRENRSPPDPTFIAPQRTLTF